MGEARRGTEQARLLRQVVLLHQEVRIHLCRLMGMHDTDYAALALLMRGRLGPSALASALGLSSAAATARRTWPSRLRGHILTRSRSG